MLCGEMFGYISLQEFFMNNRNNRLKYKLQDRQVASYPGASLVTDVTEFITVMSLTGGRVSVQ